jgi:Protein of unknown function (DUF433)
VAHTTQVSKEFNVGNLIRVPANTTARHTSAFAWDLPPEQKAAQTQPTYIDTVTGRGKVYGSVGLVPGKPAVSSADSSHSRSFVSFSTLTAFDPDPKIEGTVIPIYRISALLDGGMSINDIAEDFPSLTKTQIEQAGLYAKEHPAPFGNPYPQQSLKRLIRDSGFKKVEKELRKKIRKRS